MTSRLRFFTTLLMLSSFHLAAGCGGDVTVHSGTETTGGTGGGTSATGGATGGSGGSAITAAPECDPGMARIDGGIGVQDVHATFGAQGIALSGGVQIGFGDLGALYLSSADGDDPDVVHHVSALLRMPETPGGSLSPGEWICGGDGSVFSRDESLFDVRAVLKDVSSLGPCPGTPVDGVMDLCLTDAGCPDTLTSTVPGASFTTSLDGLVGAGGPASLESVTWSFTLKGTGGFIVFVAPLDPQSSGPQSSDVGTAWVTIPSGKPDAGAVYCVGAGSTFEYQMTNGVPTPRKLHLAGLSRKGACPAATQPGEIGFCMNVGD